MRLLRFRPRIVQKDEPQTLSLQDARTRQQSFSAEPPPTPAMIVLQDMLASNQPEARVALGRLHPQTVIDHFLFAARKLGVTIQLDVEDDDMLIVRVRP